MIAEKAQDSVGTRLPLLWAALRRVQFAQIVPWLVACVCIVLLWRPAPATTALPLEDAAYWRSGFYELEAGKTAFRWTGRRATLRIPSQLIGGQRIDLALQSGRNVPVPVRIGARDLDLVFDVAPQPRVYQILVRDTFSLRPLDISFEAPTFRSNGDPRNLGFVVFAAKVGMLHTGLPWWVLNALVLLCETAVLQFVLRRLPALLRAALPAIWLAALLLWLRADLYTNRATVVMLWLGLGIGLLCGLVAAARFGRSLPAAQTLWRSVQRLLPAIDRVHVAEWDRAATATGLALAGLAMLVRAALASGMTRFVSGDDYLVGVFALNILRGDLPLYYGHHTGTLASYLIAPVLALSGPALPALMILPIVLTGILTIALYGLGRDLFGQWGGVAAASWMVLPPFTPLIWSLRQQPGYLEALTFGSLALWGTVRLLWGTSTRAAQIRLMAGIGLAATCAIWAGYVVASILLACAVAGALAWRRLLRLPLAGYALLVAIPGLLWLLPLALYVWRHPGSNPLWWVVSFPRPPANPAAAFHGVLAYQLPLLLVGRPTVGSILEYSLLGIALIATLHAIFRAIWYRSAAAVLLLALACSTIGLFVFSSFGYLFIDVRYILPLIVALPLLLAGVVAGLHRARYGRAWAALALLGVLLANAMNLYGRVPLALDFAFPPRDEAVLASGMQQRGIRFIHSSYWIAMPVMFESGGRIVASSLVGPNRESYDSRNEQRVLAARGDATAFVFRRGGVARPAFDEYLNKHHVVCEQFVIRQFVVYDRCAPFPDVFDLSDYLPIQPGD